MLSLRSILREADIPSARNGMVHKGSFETEVSQDDAIVVDYRKRSTPDTRPAT